MPRHESDLGTMRRSVSTHDNNLSCQGPKFPLRAPEKKVRVIASRIIAWNIYSHTGYIWCRNVSDVLGQGRPVHFRSMIPSDDGEQE
jgi:hypothetical protein